MLYLLTLFLTPSLNNEEKRPDLTLNKSEASHLTVYQTIGCNFPLTLLPPDNVDSDVIG